MNNPPKNHSSISKMSDDDDEDTSSDEEEGGKKGFDMNNPPKNHSSISKMSDDDDEDTSSDEEEEDEESIRQFNKEKEDKLMAQRGEQFRLIDIGLFVQNKDDDEEDTTDSDSDDDIKVTSQTFVVEKIPKPIDEEVLYKSLRDEVMPENEKIKLDANVQDIKKQHTEILKNKDEKLKYELESKKYLDEVNTIAKLIKDAVNSDTNSLMTKLKSASHKLGIARSHVIHISRLSIILNKQFGKYVVNLIDDFMDRLSDWHNNINACAYDCRHHLGPNIWNTYGKSILATIQKRMIRDAIEELYDEVDLKKITPLSCNGFITYKVTGYFDIRIEQQDYVKKLMKEFYFKKIDSEDLELLKIRIRQFVLQTREVDECYNRGFLNWLTANESLMGTHKRLLSYYLDIDVDFCSDYLWREIYTKYPMARKNLLSPEY